MAIHVGCGSWSDKDYVGLLYASAKSATLASYAQWFDRIEINSFSHRIQPRTTVAKWVEQTPAKFRFDVKLPPPFSERPAEAARSELREIVLGAVQPILAARQLGAFLLTLPSSFTPASRRLAELDVLMERLQPHALAVELRHRSWVEGAQRAETLDYFQARKLIWVGVDLAPVAGARMMPAVDEVTNPQLAYFRLHGRNPKYAEKGSDKEGHAHDYTEAELSEIAARVRAGAAKAKDVHVTFNNHAGNFAPKAAIAFKRLLGQPTLMGPPSADAGEQTTLF